MKIVEHLAKVKLPAMLLVVLFIPFLTDSWVSYDVKSFFFSLSLTIKSLFRGEDVSSEVEELITC